MSRRGFLRSAGVGAAALALTQCARMREVARPARPNVVLVMTDDQGYGDLGCHGNPIIRTPNLDALHGESVRFENFHVCPTCAPTRSALMTGHYSLRTGIWHTIMGRSIMNADETTMAEVFADNGYRTGIFGKWHLGDNYPYRPQDRGFQETVVHGGGGVTQAPDYWGNDYFDDTYFHNGEPQKYEFELRRWPKEANLAITAAPEDGTALNITHAKMTLQDVAVAADVPEDALGVTFRVSLEAGTARLQTWFIEEDGTKRGAYYVYVRRVK